MVTRGSQPRKPGSHQFQSPRSVIVAGSRKLRTTVASSSTAIARPRPSSWMNAKGMVTNAAKTSTMMVAALVIVPAVIEIPFAIADRFESPIARLLDARQDEDVVV